MAAQSSQSRWMRWCVPVFALAVVACGGGTPDDAASSTQASVGAVEPGATSTQASVGAVEPAQSTIKVYTPDELLDMLTEEQIADIGGIECATEYVVLISAYQQYYNEEGVLPESLNDLVDGGYVGDPFVLWEVVENRVPLVIAPLPGSGCISPVGSDDGDSLSDEADACLADAQTLAVAREAYLAQFGTGTEPTQADLVAAGFLRAPLGNFDLINGSVVAVAGGRCEGVELGG